MKKFIEKNIEELKEGSRIEYRGKIIFADDNLIHTGEGKILSVNKEDENFRAYADQEGIVKNNEFVKEFVKNR